MRSQVRLLKNDNQMIEQQLAEEKQRSSDLRKTVAELRLDLSVYRRFVISEDQNKRKLSIDPSEDQLSLNQPVLKRLKTTDSSPDQDKANERVE